MVHAQAGYGPTHSANSLWHGMNLVRSGAKLFRRTRGATEAGSHQVRAINPQRWAKKTRGVSKFMKVSATDHTSQDSGAIIGRTGPESTILLGSGGGCFVRKCFTVRESRPCPGWRSPQKVPIFPALCIAKVFFPRFSPPRRHVSGICCVVLIMGFPSRLSTLGSASHDDRPRRQATLRLGLLGRQPPAANHHCWRPVRILI